MSSSELRWLLVAAVATGCGKSDGAARERVVEVGAARVTLAGKDLSEPITDETVAQLAAHRDVAAAVPRMLLVVPATGTGMFGTEEVVFEVGGFADGIDPARLADDPALAGRFVDGAGAVPVLVSPALVELYNGQIARTHGMPVIDDTAAFLLHRSPPRFTITLGKTTVAHAAAAPTGAAPRTVEAELIGVSDLAMEIGMTVPIGHVKRWNREYVGEAAAASYSSVTVTLKDERRLGAFEGWLGEHGLRVVK